MPFQRRALADYAKQAFVAELEKSHGSALRRYLAARMRNAAADVPDLVQEVFLRLLRLDNHEAIRNSQAYLYYPTFAAPYLSLVGRVKYYAEFRTVYLCCIQT